MKAIAIAFLLISSLNAAVGFRENLPIIDLRQHDWELLLASGENASYRAAKSASGWKPVRVGWRFDEMGHPEIGRNDVWLRLRLGAPPDLNLYQVGLFFTMVDDEADIYVNGRKIRTAVYHLGFAIPGPTVVDLTPYLNASGENDLTLHIRDRYVRSTGLLGNVALFRTLRYSRTPEGGLFVNTAGSTEPLSVFLHLGAALLAQGARTGFSASDLATMHLPPQALREDELILVDFAREAKVPHRMDLEALNPVVQSAPLAVAAPPLPERLPRFELLEIPVSIGATYRNPFDPQQVKVEAVFLTPSGKVERVPGFFSQDYEAVALSDEEEILLPRKGPAWMLRYRPRELGVYKAEIFVQDRTGIRKHEAGAFECVAGELPGFLRISKRDPRFFEYSNGDSFFGIGPSGWFRGKNYFFGGVPRWMPVAMLDAFYERKAANGSNYEYLGTFQFGRLLVKGGQLDPQIAWKLDHSLRTMERLGIRWLFFHDDIRRYFHYGFDTLPYSIAQGGPSPDLNSLYLEEETLAWQKHQLRYLVSRMADSPSIWIWNIGDEWKGQPGNKFSVPLVRSWIKELHEYVKAIDVYKHPHAIGEGEEAILNEGDVLPVEGWYLNHPPHPDNDWRRGHLYDLVSRVEEQLSPYMNAPYPVIDVEGGLYGWNAAIYQSGKGWGYPEGITFHQHLWLSLFEKSAAGGTEWLVNVLDHDDQLFHAKAFARFLDGVSLTAVRWERMPAAISAPKAQGWTLVSAEQSLAWVLNRDWNWLAWVDGKRPGTLNAATARIPVEKAGRYRVEFWNTFTGERSGEHLISAVGTELAVPLPGFDKDLAIKCVRMER